MNRTVDALKLLIGNFLVSGKNEVYQHMNAAIDGRIVDWFPDHIIDRKMLGRFELQIYRFMREHREEFLSEENKILSVPLGAAKIFWKSGGSSEAVVYNTSAGDRMICCANWVSGPVLLKEHVMSISKIEFYEKAR